jgi:hypothetical protein
MRKGQKLINYMSFFYKLSDSSIRQQIFYMSDSEFDTIVNTI